MLIIGFCMFVIYDKNPRILIFQPIIVIMRKNLSEPTRHPTPNTSESVQKSSYIGQKGQQSANISFKVVVIGESFVGKTALIQKFVKQNFSNEYSVTVGVDFSSRAVTIDDTLIQLQIWDTCGHDMYRSVTASFYRGACGVFLVFALNDRKSFERLNFWYDEFQEHGSPHAIIVLIGTKSDQIRNIATEEGLSMMKKMGGMFYVETSAETGLQIQELFNKTAELMYKKYKISHEFRVLAQPRKHNQSIVLGEDGPLDVSRSRLNQIQRKCC